MTARETAVAASLGALAIVMAMVAPAYFAPGNLRDLLLSNLPVLIVAIGSMLVILTGEIDISCGSMFAICSVVAGMVAKETGSVALAFLAAVSAGITLGSLAGLAVAYGRIPSIVVTLAMLVALRDGLRWATGGAWVTDLPRAFQWFGLNQESYPLVAGALALGLCAVTAWVLRGTAGGRWLYAVGLECGRRAPGWDSRGARQGGDVRPCWSADGNRGGGRTRRASVRSRAIPVSDSK